MRRPKRSYKRKLPPDLENVNWQGRYVHLDVRSSKYMRKALEERGALVTTAPSSRRTN